MKTPIISVKWLHSNLNDPNLIILDASFPSKITKENARLKEIQIENARFFDIKKCFSNQKVAFPNTFPNREQFEVESRKLGINNNTTIVVYDDIGIYSSARVWWMYRTMGHKNVYVLNGGLPEWIAKGYKTENTESKNYKTGNFTASINESSIRDYTYIKNNIKTGNSLLIDARSSGRFNGTVPDPRKELKSGHIPKSINIPYSDVLKNGKLRNQEELIPIFEEIKDKHPEELIFTCGSGVTACIVLLASEFILNNKKSIYDGSWTEWATLEGFVK